jgi:hypothetical protein
MIRVYRIGNKIIAKPTMFSTRTKYPMKEKYCLFQQHKIQTWEQAVGALL